MAEARRVPDESAMTESRTLTVTRDARDSITDAALFLRQLASDFAHDIDGTAVIQLAEQLEAFVDQWDEAQA